MGKHCVSAALAAAVLMMAGAGCGQQEQPASGSSAGTTQTPGMAGTAAPSSMLTPGTAATTSEYTQPKPYTADFFGPWNADVAKVHLPQITYEKTDNGGLKVRVQIDDHPMDPVTPHYIMWIRIEDGKGNVLGQKDFKDTDPAPPVAVFNLATAPDKIQAFERCNIHGIWTSSVDVK